MTPLRHLIVLADKLLTDPDASPRATLQLVVAGRAAFDGKDAGRVYDALERSVHALCAALEGGDHGEVDRARAGILAPLRDAQQVEGLPQNNG